MRQNQIFSSSVIPTQPKFLWFLTLSYSMILVLANWFDPRLIHIAGLDTDAGTLIFPITFLLSDLITEVYGYKNSRRTIWCGLLFNFFFILYGQLVVHLPSPSYASDNAIFDKLIGTNSRIIIASALSYICAEPFNALLMSKLKIKLHGNYLGSRFILSTILAAGADSLIFGGVAFYGSLTNDELLSLIINIWIIKVLIQIFALPLSIQLTKKLKAAEFLDIYDKNTNFNIFSLENNYTARDNEFKKLLN